MYSVSHNNEKFSKGRELKNDERTSITSGDGVSCLLLQNINTDDSGKYDVTVENALGEDCDYASLAVEGPPDPPSGTPCITTSLDSVTVAWSSSPYDGGKIVNGYAVECSMVGSDIWTTAVDECHSLSYVVRGLQPGGRYVFRVRALNVHGYSRPSVNSDIVQLEEQNECSFFEPRIVSLEPGPEFKARYEVQEELGKGRFGVVHKVIDRETNQKFAAKFIKCRTSKDRDKVQDEIDIMNLLRHQKLLQLAAAFENPRDMVMIMEYISGGELFERVVADDFTLTEKDCILFMRQICEGVAYMHSQDIVHLDLKPENIMCHTRTSHEIKIIDFGLAQKLDPKEPVRVLFGTPEFIPPEIIGYEPIGVESDMWSIGVICYVLLSGLSPFMGDNDSETFANITRADFDFEDEAFNTVSQNARDFIGALLIKRKEDRLSAEQCLKHIWLDPETHQETVVLCTDKLKKFIIRRKWQKTGNAIRALGRMATLSASRRNSANSSPNTPRPSISGTSTTPVPRMCSVNEEDSPGSPISLLFNSTNVSQESTEEELTLNNESQSSMDDSSKEDICETPKTNGIKKYRPMVKQSRVYEEEERHIDDDDVSKTDVNEDEDQEQILISETYEKITRRLNELEEKSKATTRDSVLNKKLSENNLVEEKLHSYETRISRFKKEQEVDLKPHISDSPETNNAEETPEDTESIKTANDVRNSKEVRTRACSERSDSGISDCSTLMTSSSSTPLLGKKFCIDEENEDKIYDASTTLYFNNRKNSLQNRTKDDVARNNSFKEETDQENEKPNGSLKISHKIDRFIKSRPPAPTNSIKKVPIFTYRSVAGAIKKFDTPDSASKSPTVIPKPETKPQTQKIVITENTNPSTTPIIKSYTPPKMHSSRVETIVRKLSNSDLNNGTNLNVTPSPVRYRSPSPSLLRKTQAVIAKPQNNEYFVSKQALNSPQNTNLSVSKSDQKLPLKSNSFNKADKPKSESFRKAAAFWNSPGNSR